MQVSKIRSNIALYAALTFILLSFLFSGIHCDNANLRFPENFFACFFLKALIYLLIIADAFILSLYKFFIPLAFLVQLGGCCLWGMAIKYAFYNATWLLSALMFIPAAAAGAFFCICNALIMEIFILNFRRSLSSGSAHLPFQQRFVYSFNEFKNCMTIFCLMLIEIALSCVISAILCA